MVNPNVKSTKINKFREKILLLGFDVRYMRGAFICNNSPSLGFYLNSRLSTDVVCGLNMNIL